jgi:hypothetical protein
MIASLFRRKSAHPLSDPYRAERLLGAARASANPLETAAAATDWLAAAAIDDALHPSEVARIGYLAHEAAHEAVRSLSRQCVGATALPPAEGPRLWTTLCSFHASAAACFEAAAMRGAAAPGIDLRSELPRAVVAVLRSTAAQLKWLHVACEPIGDSLWERAYQVYALAERWGLTASRTSAVGDDERTSTPHEAFARLVAFATASPGSLRLIELQALEDLIAAAVSGFTVSPHAQPEATHWLDLGAAEAPARLVRAPRPAATVRHFCGSEAMDYLRGLAERLEARGAIPAEFRREFDYGPALATAMIDHIRRYCSIDAAMRKGRRHRVDSRLEVVWDLDEILDRLQPDLSLSFVPDDCDQWQVEDASANGIKALVGGAPRRWLRVGSLVALRVQTASRWQVGVVRRVQRLRDDRTEVALQMPPCEATTVAVRPARGASPDFGLLLDGRRARAGLMVVARPGVVHNEPFTIVRDGAKLELVPVAHEAGPGYQIVQCEEALASAA